MKFKIIFVTILTMIFLSSCNEELIEFNDNETFVIPKAANEEISEKLLRNEIEIEERTYRTFEDLPLDERNVIEIDEKKFLTKIDNIKRKIDYYKNKTIVVEGMFATYTSWDDTFKGNLVYRNGPNDFNNDIWGGFFLDDLRGNEIQIDDWIKVEGTPYIYETKDSEGTEYEYLFLKVKDITIMPNHKRGLEFVNE